MSYNTHNKIKDHIRHIYFNKKYQFIIFEINSVLFLIRDYLFSNKKNDFINNRKLLFSASDHELHSLDTNRLPKFHLTIKKSFFNKNKNEYLNSNIKTFNVLKNFFKFKNTNLKFHEKVNLLRLLFWGEIWSKYLINSNIKDIYLCNDYNIYNSALIFFNNHNLIKKKINIFILQHGIPNKEFFPTKNNVTYIVWSKYFLKEFKSQIRYKHTNTEFTVNNLIHFYRFNSLKIDKNCEIDLQNIYFVSPGISNISIYEQFKKFYLDTKALKNISTHFLIHPNELRFLEKKFFKYSKKLQLKNIIVKNKIRIFISVSSTANLLITSQNNILIGLKFFRNNIVSPNLSAIMYPNYEVNSIDELNEKINLFRKNIKLVKSLIHKQNKIYENIFFK